MTSRVRRRPRGSGIRSACPRRVFSAALGIVLVACWSVNAAADEIRDARRLFKNLQYEEAEELLSSTLPTLDGRERARGLLLLAQLKTSANEARILLEEVSRQWPGSEEAENALFALARIRFAEGDYDRALDYLEECSPSSSERARAVAYWRGLAHLAREEYHQAAGWLEPITKGPFVSWSYLALGEALERTGAAPQALDRYETLSGSKTLPTADYRLGEAYEQRGDRERALKSFRTLLTTFPKSPEAALAREKVRSIEVDRVVGFGDRENETGNEAPPGVGTVPLAEAFTIQVGAFSDRSNALRLKEELERDYAPVYVLSESFQGRSIHRVRVGRFASREEAEIRAREIERRHQVKPHIVKYDQPHE